MEFSFIFVCSITTVLLHFSSLLKCQPMSNDQVAFICCNSLEYTKLDFKTHKLCCQILKTLTVPTPLKDAASIQKLFFHPAHHGAFYSVIHSRDVKIDKIH